MKCPMCNGKGMVDYPMYADNEHKWQYCVARMKKCDMCNGTGEVPMTNEEWFCGLSTEEKADFMSRVLGCSNCPIPKDGRSCMGTYSRCWHEIIKWLKQPYKGE